MFPRALKVLPLSTQSDILFGQRLKHPLYGQTPLSKITSNANTRVKAKKRGLSSHFERGEKESKKQKKTIKKNEVKKVKKESDPRQRQDSNLRGRNHMISSHTH